MRAAAVSASWSDSRPPSVLEQSGRRGTVVLFLVLVALIVALGLAL